MAIQIDWSRYEWHGVPQTTKYSREVPDLRDALELWLWDFQDALVSREPGEWNFSDLQLEGRRVITLNVRPLVSDWDIHVVMNVKGDYHKGYHPEHFFFHGDIFGHASHWRSDGTLQWFTSRASLIDIIWIFMERYL